MLSSGGEFSFSAVDGVVCLQGAPDPTGRGLTRPVSNSEQKVTYISTFSAIAVSVIPVLLNELS